MASSWANGLHPQLRPYFEYLYALAAWADPGAVVTSGYRTRAQQEILWRRAQAGLSKFPAARPGTSLHEQGRALDMVARPEVLQWLGAVWTSWGGTWGGAKDPIHFQA